jgi:micrococcal nuclease
MQKETFLTKLKNIGFNRYSLFLFLVVLIVGVFVSGSYVWERRVSKQKVETQQATPTKEPESNPEVKGDTQYKVERTVDGDTIEIKIGDKTEKLRYIGVNTPETVKPNTPVQCFGKESSDFNKSLVEGKSVVLEKDISERDRYGRLLRYVYLVNDKGELEMVNKKLIEEGYASVSTFPPDVKYQKVFLAAEKRAKEGKKGLWASCPNKP